MEKMGNVNMTSHNRGCFRTNNHPKCTSNLCWCCNGDVHTCHSTMHDCQAQCLNKMNDLQLEQYNVKPMYECSNNIGNKKLVQSSVELFLCVDTDDDTS